MMSALRTIQVLASAALFIAPSSAQTYSNCNPLSRSDCPPDSALARKVDISFSSSSDSFTPQGNPTYDSNGASFTVRQSGDSPQLTSKWYIMFGRVEVVMKAAPGAGIVSSVVLQSDTLDEIDWEWLGASPNEVQTNYFGKGQTTTYNRGAFHAAQGSQAGFKKYTIDWSADQVVWQIDGTTVRALKPADAQGQYPQTPMQLKMGAWSGGDPANAPGTIQWAKGPTNYANGPFTMQVKSISVTDYSTGTQYRYKDQTGTWESIEAVGGKVNPRGGTVVDSAAPAVTSSSSGQPIPFQGTHQQSSDVSRPTEYPWVPQATTLQAAPTVTYTNYPGLPSGWTVSSSGKVVPPSSAPGPSPLAISTPSPLPSAASVSAGGYEVITGYDDRGFTTVRTVPAGYTAAPKVYDDKGFPVAASPAPAPPATTLSAVALKAATQASASPSAGKNGASGSIKSLGYSAFTFSAFLSVLMLI